MTSSKENNQKMFWMFYKPLTTQQKGILSSDRTTGTRPFQVIGTDFAGPIMYCKNRSRRTEVLKNVLCKILL